MTLEEIKAIEDLDIFKVQLKLHDWTYDYSDMIGVWTAGNRVKLALMALAEANGAEWKYAFNEEHMKHLNGVPYPSVEPF